MMFSQSLRHRFNFGQSSGARVITGEMIDIQPLCRYREMGNAMLAGLMVTVLVGSTAVIAGLTDQIVHLSQQQEN
jgi:hypothetical protein